MKTLRLIGIWVMLAASLVGCAAKTATGRAQVAALAIGTLVGAVDDAERSAHASGLVSEAAHVKSSAAVLRALYAAQAIERLAAGATARSSRSQAAAQLRGALLDVDAALPDVPAVGKATAVVRAVLAAGGY